MSLVIIPPMFSIPRDGGVAPKEEDVHNIASQYTTTASSGITVHFRPQRVNSDEGRLISVCVVNRRWWLGVCWMAKRSPDRSIPDSVLNSG